MKEPECCYAKLPITKRLMSGISDAPKICSQKQLLNHVQGGICPGASVCGRQCNVSYLMVCVSNIRLKKNKVLLAGGVGIQTSPHHQMFLTETAPVTVMDGEHFTLPDIFWMTCWGSGDSFGFIALPGRVLNKNHEGEVNIKWPDVSAINYLTNEMPLLRKWSF